MGIYGTGMGGATIAKAEKEVRRMSTPGEVRRFWSIKDDLLLIKVRTNGGNPNQAAELLGRSYNSCADRTVKLANAGILIPVKEVRNCFEAAEGYEQLLEEFHAAHQKRGIGEAWTTELDDKVCDLEMDGKSPKEIAPIINRTPLAVQARLVKLRQEGEIPPANRKWTDQDDNRLRALFYQDYDDAFIARETHRTANAVIRRRQKLGLKRDARGLPIKC